ncbi:MAG: D-2-hydroxyacid dehydrogenase [Haloarculaceae archaeon]
MGDWDDLAAAIEDRLPDADITVARSRGETQEHITSATVLIAIGLSDELLGAATDLQWIQSLYAGVGAFDVPRLRERGVVLTSGAGIHSEAVAETVFGYLLIFERGFLRGLSQQRDRTWKRYPTGELVDGTLGIVGLGEIGRRVAELGRAFGMTVIGTKRDPDVDIDPVDEVFGPEDLHTVANRSDYVVIACPLTDETCGLFGREEFVAMPSSAVLINVARGPIVDESALVTALGEGLIRGAALDVTDPEPLPPESPLWSMPEVIVTPHIAGSTDQYWRRGAELFADNYAMFVDGRLDEMKNRVV